MAKIRSNKRNVVRLTPDERERLQRLVSAGQGSAAKLKRASVLLQADQSCEGPAWTDSRIADALGVTIQTSENIRRRFAEEGLESVLERKKPSRPAKERLLADGRVAVLQAIRRSQAPPGRRRWTLRLLAEQLVAWHIVESIGHETVRRTLQRTRDCPEATRRDALACGV
jgi:transposase